MLWGQRIKVWTDHKKIIQDALGLTSDLVYRWRLLLEEYGPDIEYIKGVKYMVADDVSHLDYNPEVNPPRSLHHLQWLSDEHGVKAKHLKMKALSKNVSLYDEAYSHEESGEENSSASKCETANEATSFVFVNRSEE